MFRGHEHDAVFETDQLIVAFEFTKQSLKDKAIKDATKVKDILLHLKSQPGNRYKGIVGYVVTLIEPTADQRHAVTAIAKSAGIQINCMSLIALQRSLIDTESYIAARREAPFGSTAYNSDINGRPARSMPYVNPPIVGRGTREIHSIGSVVADLASGKRFILTADFGAGKSEALRQIFEHARKNYFRSPGTFRFPLHMNLRDFFGLRSPREALRRHAEDVGFSADASLISAWRSGGCDLLLDGFDELVPSRWVGGARDLRQVRWHALSAVRELVNDTPQGCGIIVAGRAQYFSGDDELASAVGLPGSQHIELEDFDDERVTAFVGDLETPLPEWIPTRPLLLKFLLQNDLLRQVDESAAEPSQVWHAMLRAVAAREADRISSVTPESVLSLIARVATLARAGESPLGPISVNDMRSAFTEVCGYDPEEEGLQLLLRLPGLAAVPAGTAGQSENRIFLDESLCEAAYGEDLARYVATPFANHPLNNSVPWSNAGGELVAGVAASALAADGYQPGIVQSALTDRMNHNRHDPVLLDVARVGDSMLEVPTPTPAMFFSEILVPRLALSGLGYLGQGTFQDCVIETLDVVDVAVGSQLPTFLRCLIGSIEGWSEIPAEFALNFKTSDIDRLSAKAETTDALNSLQISTSNRLGLIILRKVYAQKGAGRKASALVRGLALNDRSEVSGVTDHLLSSGYLLRVGGKGDDDLLIPVKKRRSEVMAYLSAPQTFELTKQ